MRRHRPPLRADAAGGARPGRDRARKDAGRRSESREAGHCEPGHARRDPRSAVAISGLDQPVLAARPSPSGPGRRSPDPRSPPGEYGPATRSPPRGGDSCDGRGRDTGRR